MSNHGAVWSPDGKWIAFAQPDESEVKLRSELVPDDPSYPKVREVRSARVGGTIATLRVGVVDDQGKETRWLPIPMPAEGFYLGEIGWAGNSEELLIKKLSRFRNEREFLLSQPTEFFQFAIGRGVVLDAWMIKPPGFDPSKKYPVLVYVYGEPHAQTVLDAWGKVQADYHRVIADLGFLVVSIDNRGTPAPKGAAWRRAIFGSLGPGNPASSKLNIAFIGSGGERPPACARCTSQKRFADYNQ